MRVVYYRAQLTSPIDVFGRGSALYRFHLGYSLPLDVPRIAAETLTPSYWINMGALAIATLAGSRLLLAANRWSFFQELSTFLKDCNGDS